MPYYTPSNPDPSNDFGLALLAGRLVGTIVGSDGHITVRAWAKRKADNGRWVTCHFDDAYLVDLSVPGADGDWADKIATWYPDHSSSKWAGRFFRDRAQTDDRRVKAAEYLLDVAAGKKDGTHVEISKRCLRCGKELTHPDSIKTNFGPDCAKELGIENNSGTDAAPHSKKTPTTTEEAIAQHTREFDEAGERRVLPQPQEFVPPKASAIPNSVDNTPKPEVDADENVVARLRAGDDPKKVLAELNAR